MCNLYKKSERNVKMKKFRISSLLLALLTLASCGQTGTNDPSGTSDTTPEVTTEPTPTKLEYPYEFKDYGGKTFTFLNCIDKLWSGSNHILDYESLSGDTVSDEIYNRARDTEANFGVKIEVIKEDIWQLYGNIQEQVLAGEPTYDAAYAPLKSTMTGEYALDLMKIDSLHLDSEWWNVGFIDQATIEGKLYTVLDYVNMMGYSYGNVMYFNKELVENHNLDMLYDAVREGKWTYDMMAQYMKAVSSLNGDEKFTYSLDAKCVFGFGVQHEEGTMTVLNGSGERLVAKNKDGIPELSANVERFSNAYSKLCQILSPDGMTIMYEGQKSERRGEKTFKAGRALFYQGNLGLSGDAFRELEFEYGVIPAPKYDEAQADYYTMASEYALSLVVPKTASDPDMTGRVLDYMAYRGKVDVIPALQVQLCYKGMRDDDSIEMFETILSTLSLDIGYMFGWTQSLVKTLCGDDMLNGNDKFASSFAAQKDQIKSAIEKTLTAMNEN